MRLRAKKSRCSKNRALFINFGAPTQWAKLRSPLGSINTPVVLVGARGVHQQAAAIDPFAFELPADDGRPFVAADVAEGRRPHPQPGHGDARIAQDAAGGHLDRFRMKQPAGADRHFQGHRPNQHVDHAGTAKHAIKISGRFSVCHAFNTPDW